MWNAPSPTTVSRSGNIVALGSASTIWLSRGEEATWPPTSDCSFFVAGTERLLGWPIVTHRAAQSELTAQAELIELRRRVEHIGDIPKLSAIGVAVEQQLHVAE